MTEPAPARPTRFRTGGLSQRKPTRFSFMPDPAQRQAMAAELGLLALHRLDLTGQIEPVGRDEFRLQARLVAVADQACIVTLAPVRTEVDEEVLRRYVAGLALPEADESEIPEDDTLEPLPETVDIVEIATEALMLALPLYPRAPGAEFGLQSLAPEDAEPIVEERAKPFASLASLAERLKTNPEKGGSGGEGDPS